jgi:hypothetical protein
MIRCEALSPICISTDLFKPSLAEPQVRVKDILGAMDERTRIRLTKYSAKAG